MSDLDLRFDQVRRRRFDAQTGKDREVEHQRERALARRTAVPPAKALRIKQMRRAQLRVARQADLYRRDPEYRWRHSAPVA